MVSSVYQVLILDRKGGASPGKLGDVSELLENKETLPWIHLDYSQPQASEWIENAAFLDGIVKTNLQDEDSRPRAIRFPGGIFLSLRGVNLNQNADPDDMIGVRLWATEKLIVSSSRRKLFSIEDLGTKLHSGSGPKNASGLILNLVDGLAVKTEHVVEALELKLEELEENLLEAQQAQQRTRLSDLRRQAIRLKRFLSPQKEALTHLLNDPPEWFVRKEKSFLKEYLNIYKRYLEELDSIKERAIVAQEELIVKLSESVNSRTYILSLVATLFLPLSFLTGLLGINVGGIPWAENQMGFIIICSIMVIVAMVMIAFMMKGKWFQHK